MKSSLVASMLCVASLLVGCATPAKLTNSRLVEYDRNTDYAVDESSNGFTVSIRYARYQFLPESDAVAVACRQQATAIAWEVARTRGREIQPVHDQEVRISMGRNGVSGITSCTASVPVYYKQ